MSAHKECYVEFHRIGNQVKVTAIDPISGREVCIIGAVSARAEDLSALALRKLNYVLNKETKD